MATPGAQGIIYADERFGLHQLRFNEGAGAYASQSGEIVARWASQWERPEHWIFDFNHHLFAGDNSQWAIGIAGVCDRKSDVEGQRGSVRDGQGGGWNSKKKK